MNDEVEEAAIIRDDEKKVLWTVLRCESPYQDSPQRKARGSVAPSPSPMRALPGSFRALAKNAAEVRRNEEYPAFHISGCACYDCKQREFAGVSEGIADRLQGKDAWLHATKRTHWVWLPPTKPKEAHLQPPPEVSPKTPMYKKIAPTHSKRAASPPRSKKQPVALKESLELSHAIFSAGDATLFMIAADARDLEGKLEVSKTIAMNAVERAAATFLRATPANLKQTDATGKFVRPIQARFTTRPEKKAVGVSQVVRLAKRDTNWWDIIPGRSYPSHLTDVKRRLTHTFAVEGEWLSDTYFRIISMVPGTLLPPEVHVAPFADLNESIAFWAVNAFSTEGLLGGEDDGKATAKRKKKRRRSSLSIISGPVDLLSLTPKKAKELTQTLREAVVEEEE